jgi:hypothetical protein
MPYRSAPDHRHKYTIEDRSQDVWTPGKDKVTRVFKCNFPGCPSTYRKTLRKPNPNLRKR